MNRTLDSQTLDIGHLPVTLCTRRASVRLLDPTARAASSAIFDAFRDEQGRQNHLNGPIAQALMAQAPNLLASPPTIERMEVLGVKQAA